MTEFIFAVVLILAVIFWWRRSRRSGGAYGNIPGPFLCQSCKFNSERYCQLPYRPRATHCEDYEEIIIGN